MPSDSLPKPEVKKPELTEINEPKALKEHVVPSENKSSDVKKRSDFPNAKAIQPRSKSAVWVYRAVYFEDGKAVPNGSSKEEVLEVVEIDGVNCYRVRLTMDWRSILDRLAGVQLSEEDYWNYWDYSDAKGSHHFDPEKEEKKRPEKLSDFDLTLPYPVEKGHKYVVDDTQYEVLHTAKKAKVPAGEFTCVVYQLTGVGEQSDEEKWRDRLFMAKGVGAVVAEGDVWAEGKWKLDYRDELTSYDLKNVDLPEANAEQVDP